MNGRRAHCQGVALIDALTAMAVLGIGLLGVGALQSRTLDTGTQAQVRQLAQSLEDELVALALVDPDNGACYRIPAAASGCSSTAAETTARRWADKAAAALPAGSVTRADFDGRNLHVTLTWPAKGKTDTHQLETTTDVRP